MSIIYGLRQMFQHRADLRSIIHSKEASAKTLLDLSPQALKTRGVDVLALDFDGVLSYQDAIMPNEKVMVWLHNACAIFQEKNIYLLTNNPLPARAAFFNKTFPAMTFVSFHYKKPHPEGLEKIIAQSGVKPDQVVLVDDRLTTGILATCIAGTQAIYITQPFVNLKGNHVKEQFFKIIRALERWFFT